MLFQNSPINYLFINYLQKNHKMTESLQSQVFDPSNEEIQAQSNNQVYPKPRLQKSNISAVQGKWDQEENLQYVTFMDYHSDIFSSKTKRKNLKIFKTLSTFLNSRTPRQCRSHFQKLMNRFKSFKKIISYYQNLIGMEKYKSVLQVVTDKIKPKPVEIPQNTRQQKSLKIKDLQKETQTDFPDLMKEYVFLMDRMRIVQEQNMKYQWMLRLSMSLPNSFPFR